jgi:hypothetical protein
MEDGSINCIFVYWACKMIMNWIYVYNFYIFGKMKMDIIEIYGYNVMYFLILYINIY